MRGLRCSDEKDQEAFARRASTLCVLMSNACSSEWSLEFTNILANSAEMRAPTLSEVEKAQYPCICMACGRHEEKNMRALDLGGILCGKLNDPLTFASECESNSRRQEWVMRNPGPVHLMLHPLDKGRYMLGETCLRRAQLYFLCRNWLYEVFRVTRDHVDHMRRKDGALRPTQRYMQHDVQRWHESFDTLCELVRATSNKPLRGECVPYDHVFWRHIDLAREGACECDPTRLIKRMRETEEVTEDAIAEADEALQQPVKKRGHKRRLVSDDDESSDSSSDGSSDEEEVTASPIKTRQCGENAKRDKKAALLALIDVQRQLTEKGQSVLAKKVTQAIMFMQS